MRDRAILQDIAASFGTPTYVYDEARIAAQCRALSKSFKGFDIHYAMKANSNPAVLEAVRACGLGVEAVSQGELAMARRAGFPREKISFTCSSTSEDALRAAGRTAGRVHLDSLRQIELWGRTRLNSSISLRLNQGIGGGHHAHVITGGPDSKFGITLKDLPRARALAKRYGLTVTGLQQHLGSNILDEELFLRGAKRLLATAREFSDLEYLDYGGGLGIPYNPNDRQLNIAKLGRELAKLSAAHERTAGKKLRFAIEPGRYVVGEAGTFLVTVTDIKATAKHSFVGVDSGFNHLLRPAMYDSYHEIENVSRSRGREERVTVVGNVCESGDVFARGRKIIAPRIGDVLAIRTAGAYGFSMASNYNLRRLPAEVLVRGGKARDVSFAPGRYAR
ncbi:MAG TPA: diaminopimelate decarboxylase [Candidatus Paceibacterota bacterium]|nr:diaminopimelate decarboxylase [Candidatus Paceibacterota bacterium]